MTVSELIAELQKMPQQAEVYIVEEGDEHDHGYDREPHLVLSRQRYIRPALGPDGEYEVDRVKL